MYCKLEVTIVSRFLIFTFNWWHVNYAIFTTLILIYDYYHSALYSYRTVSPVYTDIVHGSLLDMQMVTWLVWKINYFDFENHKADMIDTQLKIVLKVDIITAIFSLNFFFLRKDPFVTECTGLQTSYVLGWFLFSTDNCVLNKKHYTLQTPCMYYSNYRYEIQAMYLGTLQIFFLLLS
jgi:hypothetical protein